MRSRPKAVAPDPAQDPIDALLGAPGRAELEEAFGLAIDGPATLLRTLEQVSRELGSAVAVEDLAVLGDVDPRLATKSVSWADVLGLVSIAPQPSGPPTWTVDPIVARLLDAAAKQSSASATV